MLIIPLNLDSVLLLLHNSKLAYYNARAQLLLCSLILLFSEVAVAVVDFFSSLKSLLLLVPIFEEQFCSANYKKIITYCHIKSICMRANFKPAEEKKKKKKS